MGNPDPVQTDDFKAKQYKALGKIPGNQPLSKKQTQIRLPQNLYDALQAMPRNERVNWIRWTLYEAAIADGLIEGQPE